MPDVHRIAADMDSDAAANQPPHERAAVPRLGFPGATARWRAMRAFAIALAIAVLLGACGSSTSSVSSAQVKKQTCKQVEAVLSDGPEPEADPVGYAQAQVLPLREIHTSDGKLHQAIDGLASAYQELSSSNGHSAKSAVTAASKTIDAICPGATS